MEKTYKTTESSELYRKINALELTPSHRARALAALETAERLVDTISWLAGKFTQFGAVAPARGIAPSNKLKHQ